MSKLTVLSGKFILTALSISVGGLSFAQTTSTSFFSMHQIERKIAIGLDSAGLYKYSPALTGFRNQYNPVGVTGCGIGMPQFVSECYLSTGLSAFVSGYSGYREIKTYIPAGTLMFSVAGFLPQNTSYAVAARIGRPPSRTAALSSAEYQTVKTGQNRNLAFNRLLAGQEVILVHDGGGVMILSGNGVLQRWPTTKGAWIYMRVLNGDEIYNLQYLNRVDTGEYVRWYNEFSRVGGFNTVTKDPNEVVFTPVKPTGIKLSSDIVSPGGEVLIRPLEDNAMIIGQCTLTSGETNVSPENVSLTNYTITVDAAASDQIVTVHCGNAADVSGENQALIPVFTKNLTVRRGGSPSVPVLSIGQSSLTPGQSTTLSIANATDIGTCTASVPNLLAIGQKSADKLSVSVTVPQAAVVTADTSVTIACDSVPASPQTITVKKPTNTDNSSTPGGSVVQNNVSDVGFSPDTDDKLKVTYKNSIFGYPSGFNCQSNEYVDYSVGSVFPRIVLKSTVTLPSSLVLSTLTCSVGAGTLKSDFYISKSSDGVVRLLPTEPPTTLIKEVTPDNTVPVKLKGVVPTSTDTGELKVWFGVELKSGEKYALVWSDTARKNEWRSGFPDLTPSSSMSYTPVQAKNNEFAFDLAGITQSAIDSYKADGGTIKGTVYYQFGSGAVRQLHTVWVP